MIASGFIRPVAQLWLLTTVCLFVVSSPVRAQEEAVSPDDVYLEAYLIMQEGTAAAEAGRDREAYEKLSKADQIIGMIGRSHPNWNRQMREYRQKKIREGLATLHARISAGQSAPPVGTGPGPLPNPTPNPLPPTPPPLPLPDPLPPVGTGGSAGTGDLGAQMDQRIRNLEAQLKRQQEENQRQQLAYERQRQELAQRISEIAEFKRQDVIRRRQLADAETRLRQAEAAQGSEMNTLKTEVIRLKRELEKTNEGLAAASEETKKVLLNLDGARDRIASLEEEKSELAAERDQMASLVKSWEQGSDEAMKKLMADHRKVQEEFKKALAQVEKLEDDGAEKEAEIARLGDHLKEVKSEMAALREEQTASEIRIADLTTRLKDTSAMLAGSADGAVLDAAVREENKILRGVILRQLRHQARVQGTKKLMAEELAKLEGSSLELLQQFEEITSTKLLLTPAEQSLFRDPSGEGDRGRHSRNHHRAVRSRGARSRAQGGGFVETGRRQSRGKGPRHRRGLLPPVPRGKRGRPPRLCQPRRDPAQDGEFQGRGGSLEKSPPRGS